MQKISVPKDMHGHVRLVTGPTTVFISSNMASTACGQQGGFDYSPCHAVLAVAAAAAISMSCRLLFAMSEYSSSRSLQLPPSASD